MSFCLVDNRIIQSYGTHVTCLYAGVTKATVLVAFELINSIVHECRVKDIEADEGFSADIPNSALKLRVRIIENKGDLEYNNSSWFCPVEAFHEGRLTLGNCSGSASGLHIRKAGSAGGKDLKRLMTDLKIPGSARGQVLFIRDGGEVLWLPGFGHGVGFTNSVSRERYIAGRADEGAEPGRLVRFAIERKQ